MVRILRLVVDHDQDAVVRAVTKALARGLNSVDAVATLLLTDRDTEPTQPAAGPQVGQVDLREYDVLLTTEGGRVH